MSHLLGGWTKKDSPSSLKKAYSKPFYGMYNTSTQDAPSNYGFYFAFPMTQPNGNENNGLVIAVQNDFTKLFINGSWGNSGYNSKWTEVSLIQQS